MENFFTPVEKIPNGIGFSTFSGIHIAWLCAFVIFSVAVSIIYRKSSESNKKRIRIFLVAFLLTDELFKVIGLAVFGNYLPSYLPFHLCSINIFLITYHAFKPTKLCGNFLYTVCIPAAIAALLFPTWTALPTANFMHIHSFTVHILLGAYPIIMTAGGDIKPDVRMIPKCLLLLISMAIPVYFVNILMDTNFMFLMSADPGNPLYWFETAWGSHLYGFPILITAVLFVMFLPVYIISKRKKVAKV